MPAAGLLETVRRTMYTGPLERLSKRYGLHDRLLDYYAGVYDALPASTVDVDVGDTRATFRVSTLAERGAVNEAMGAERPLILRLVDELERGDVFWDVGANVGTHACLVGRAIADGTVVCFEPYPPNADRLEANLALNDVTSTVVRAALSNEEGSTTLHTKRVRGPGAQEGTIAPRDADDGRASDAVSVEVTTGDAVVTTGRAPTPDVVKLDVEGAALDVLDGLEATIGSNRPRLVVVETHGNFDAVDGRLTDLGFDVEYVRLAGDRSTEAPTLFASAPVAD